MLTSSDRREDGAPALLLLVVSARLKLPGELVLRIGDRRFVFQPPGDLMAEHPPPPSRRWTPISLSYVSS